MNIKNQRNGKTLTYMGEATPEMLMALWRGEVQADVQGVPANTYELELCYHCKKKPELPGYGGLCEDCPKLVHDGTATLGDHTGETAYWEEQGRTGTTLGDTTGESSDGTDGLDWNRNLYDSY